MSKLEKVKEADTITLCELADEAREHDFDRQLNTDIIDALDPEGIHVLFFADPLERNGGSVYFRTTWMLKVKGRVESAKAVLDIMPEQFNALPERQQIEEADSEEE
jgi:hypothetical protein